MIKLHLNASFAVACACIAMLYMTRIYANKYESEEILDARSEERRQALNGSLAKLLHGLPAKDGQWCQRMASGNLDERLGYSAGIFFKEFNFWEQKRLEHWKFVENHFLITRPTAMKNKSDKDTVKMNAEEGDPIDGKCFRLRKLFPFYDEPLSDEERQFPLAYGLLVHKSPIQVLAMISAIYQPQNAYCLIVDEKATETFKQHMQLLADCMPNNIFLLGTVGKVEWCKFGVTRAVFTCLRHLAESRHPWKYYQYLSGVDLPLKTNLEMVRIFKQLNGTVNMEIKPEKKDLLEKDIRKLRTPLPLWKSSLSALISREAANAIVRSQKVQQLMRFLQHVSCSDEAIWASSMGNPKELSIPGGFDAGSFLGANNRCYRQRTANGSTVEYGNGRLIAQSNDRNESFHPVNYYIARYQVWQDSKEDKCLGKIVKWSCVYGIKDIPLLLQRPELIAHKMYLDYQPAAYFCLWKTVQERALDWRKQREFQATEYGNLPTVNAANNNGKNPFDNKCYLSLPE